MFKPLSFSASYISEDILTDNYALKKVIVAIAAVVLNAWTGNQKIKREILHIKIFILPLHRI